MLVLSRRVGETVRIGDTVVTVLRVEHGRVKLGIDADRTVPILRGELEPGGTLTSSATAREAAA